MSIIDGSMLSIVQRATEVPKDKIRKEVLGKVSTIDLCREVVISFPCIEHKKYGISTCRVFPWTMILGFSLLQGIRWGAAL